MSKQNTALITGITRRDGAYLAELLLEKGEGVDEKGIIDSIVPYSQFLIPDFSFLIFN